MALYASVKVGFRTVFHFGDRQAAQRRCWFPLPKSRQNHQPVVVLTCQLLMHRVKGHFGSKVSGDFRLAVCTRAASDLGLPDWATYRRLGYLLKLPAAKNGLLGKFRATFWMTWNFGWRIWATFCMLLATFCRKLRQPWASEQTGKMAVVGAWTESLRPQLSIPIGLWMRHQQQHCTRCRRPQRSQNSLHMSRIWELIGKLTSSSWFF